MKPEFMNRLSDRMVEFRERRVPTHYVFPIPREALEQPVEDMQKIISEEYYLSNPVQVPGIFNPKDPRLLKLITTMHDMRLTLSPLTRYPFSNTAYVQGARFSEMALRQSARIKKRPLLALTDNHINTWSHDWLGPDINMGIAPRYPLEWTLQTMKNEKTPQVMKPEQQYSVSAGSDTGLFSLPEDQMSPFVRMVAPLLVTRDQARLAAISPDTEPNLYSAMKEMGIANEKLPFPDFEQGVADVYSIYQTAHEIETLEEQWSK